MEGRGKAFSGKTVSAFLKSREYVSSKDRSCAGPGPEDVLVLEDIHRLCSQTVLNLYLVLWRPQQWLGLEAWSPVPTGAGLDFHHGFPLLGTFYGVHMMSSRACDHRAILGSCAP